MIYSYADKAIKEINRRNLHAFNRLKQLKFDELNILQAVYAVYDASVRLCKRWYLMIARKAYIEAMKEAKKRGDEDSITEDWLLDMMEEYDPVTLYRFTPEVERKKQRLVEAIMASHDRNDVIERALKLWTLQTSHYADKSVDDARLTAFEDAGVKKVRWVTAEDDRVCSECRKRNGKIYPIDNIPEKPHYRCRCYFVPVID